MISNVVNTFKIVHGRMPEAFHVLDDMGIYVSHPRQGRQTYHFMEAYTYLINVAIQPQLHPPVCFPLLSSWNRSPRSILWISALSESILGVPRLPNSFKIFSLKISDLSCCISEKPRKCQIPTDCVRRPWYECNSEPDSHRRSSTTGISVMEVS